MQWEPSDSSWRAQVHALNQPFLDLVARCPTAHHAQLGLSPPVTAAIVAMDRSRREELAKAPFLLARLEPVNSSSVPGRVGEEPAAVDPWTRDSQVYASALLTFLWKSVRCPDSHTVFMVGHSREQWSWLMGLTVRDISMQSLGAPACLVARLGHCRPFWEALVRSGGSVDAHLPRLWMISLVAAET